MSIKRLGSNSITSPNLKTSKVWDQETFPGTYESISTAIVDSSGASSITFSNIPQNYAHLQVRAIARSARNEPNDYIYLRFNSDSGNNYSWRTFEAEGAGAPVFGQGISTSQIFTIWITTAQTSAGIFGTGVIDILEYSKTNKIKTVRTLSGNERNGAGAVVFGTGLWQNSNAISTITLTNHGATNFQQHSYFALYGIRGA